MDHQQFGKQCSFVFSQISLLRPRAAGNGLTKSLGLFGGSGFNKHYAYSGAISLEPDGTTHSYYFQWTAHDNRRGTCGPHMSRRPRTSFTGSHITPSGPHVTPKGPHRPHMFPSEHHMIPRRVSPGHYGVPQWAQHLSQGTPKSSV